MSAPKMLSPCQSCDHALRISAGATKEVLCAKGDIKLALSASPCIVYQRRKG
jgi:hypothetical protein